MRIRLWPIEARLHSIAPYVSSITLLLLAICGGAYALTMQYKHDRAVHCLAENIYHEARSEGRADQYKIGMITLARVADPRWPRTVCGVVAQERQFSWTLDHKLATSPKEQAKWEDAQFIARDLIAHAWTRYKLPRGWQCVRHYKRTDGKGVSRNGAKFFETLFPVEPFGSHTAFENRRGCKHPLPTA